MADMRQLRKVMDTEKKARQEIEDDFQRDQKLIRIRRRNLLQESDTRLRQALLTATQQALMADEKQKIKQMHDERVHAMKENHQNKIKPLKDRIAAMSGSWYELCIVPDANDVHKNECQICFQEYSSSERSRVYYISCRHAKSCLECANRLWQINRECPHCRTVQAEKPIKIID